MKKIIVVVLAITVIILITIGFKSCSENQPETNQNISTEDSKSTETETAIKEASTTANEQLKPEDLESPDLKTAFIEASIEFGCILDKNPPSEQTMEKIKLDLNNIYKKHGLPTENDEKMKQIFKHFENDKDVLNKITEGTTNC